MEADHEGLNLARARSGFSASPSTSHRSPPATPTTAASCGRCNCKGANFVFVRPTIGRVLHFKYFQNVSSPPSSLFPMWLPEQLTLLLLVLYIAVTPDPPPATRVTLCVNQRLGLTVRIQRQQNAAGLATYAITGG